MLTRKYQLFLIFTNWESYKLAATNASVHYYPFIGGSTTTIERETGSFGSVGYEQGALGA